MWDQTTYQFMSCMSVNNYLAEWKGCVGDEAIFFISKHSAICGDFNNGWNSDCPIILLAKALHYCDRIQSLCSRERIWYVIIIKIIILLKQKMTGPSWDLFLPYFSSFQTDQARPPDLAFNQSYFCGCKLHCQPRNKPKSLSSPQSSCHAQVDKKWTSAATWTTSKWK